MALRLNGSSSGYVELDVPAAAGSHTLTLPNSGGTSGQYLQTNGSGGLSWQTVASPDQVLTWPGTATAVGSLSEVEFSNIPTDVKRITIHLYDLSTTGTNTGACRLQVGSGGTTLTSGYRYVNSYDGNANVATNGDHIPITNPGFTGASHVFYSLAILESINSSNRWAIQANTGSVSQASALQVLAGGFSPSGALDYIRLFTSGTTWDQGFINIMYEG